MERLYEFIIFVIIIVVIVINATSKEKKQKEAHEKVIELIKEGHDAEVCPQCKGRGASWGSRCYKCGGIGYTYKLNKEKLRKKDEKNG